MIPNEQIPEITGELPPTVTIADRLRRLVDFIGRYGAWLIVPVVVVTCIDVIARKVKYVDDQGRIHSLQLWMQRERRPGARLHRAAGAGVALPRRAVLPGARLRRDLQHPRAHRPDPRQPRLPQEGLARVRRAHLLHDPVLRAGDLLRGRLRAQLVHGGRGLGVDGGTLAPLGHQERARDRAHRGGDRRDRGLAAGRHHPVGAAGAALSADDARLAGDGTEDRGQDAGEARGRVRAAALRHTAPTTPPPETATAPPETTAAPPR